MANGSFEKNGRQAFYPSHYADPLRVEANNRRWRVDRIYSIRVRLRKWRSFGRSGRYPLSVLHKTCAYLGASTGEAAWLDVRDVLRKFPERSKGRFTI